VAWHLGELICGVGCRGPVLGVGVGGQAFLSFLIFLSCLWVPISILLGCDVAEGRKSREFK